MFQYIIIIFTQYCPALHHSNTIHEIGILDGNALQEEEEK